jgi:hypothetical protein
MTGRFPGSKENSEGLFAEESTHLTINYVTSFEVAQNSL